MCDWSLEILFAFSFPKLFLLIVAYKLFTDPMSPELPEGLSLTGGPDTLDGVDALLVEKPSLAPMGPTDFELNDMARFSRLSRSSSRSDLKVAMDLW